MRKNCFETPWKDPFVFSRSTHDRMCFSTTRRTKNLQILLPVFLSENWTQAPYGKSGTWELIQFWYYWKLSYPYVNKQAFLPSKAAFTNSSAVELNTSFWRTSGPKTLSNLYRSPVVSPRNGAKSIIKNQKVAKRKKILYSY